LKFWIDIQERRPVHFDWDLMYSLNTNWTTCVLNLYPNDHRQLWDPPKDLLLRSLVEDLSNTYYHRVDLVFYAGFDAIQQIEDINPDIESDIEL